MKCLNFLAMFLLSFVITQGVAAEDAAEKERFHPVGPDIVYDSQTDLMWASRDNGKDIDWYDAERYCNEFAAGGYADWRLPAIEELASLYAEDEQNSDGYFITDHITITSCCVWSSDTNMGGAAVFSFKSGRKPAGFLADTYQLRALPVRSIRKKGSDATTVMDRGAD